jgi:hypothetical protein
MMSSSNLGKPGVTFGDLTPVLIGILFFLLSAGLLFCLFTDIGPAAAVWSVDDYAKATLESQHVSAAPASAELFLVDPDHPLTLVTWISHRYVSTYHNSDRVDRDIWVPAAPFLRIFCQNVVKSNGLDLAKLDLRLKQRLGLPPNADYDTFVELRIDSPRMALLFRPCGGDPTISENNCSAQLPQLAAVWKLPDTSNLSPDDRQTEWVLRNYYANYSAANPYPWTALGYTFDWHKDSQGHYFRRGEIEFVLPAGAQFQFLSATSTALYYQP